MDLSTLDTLNPAESGTSVEIENPFTGEPITDDSGKRWTISVRGEDSATVRAVVKKQQNKFTERLRKRGQFGDADSVQQEQIERLEAATIGWENAPNLDGNPFGYSQENARKLYSDPRFSWVVEQVSQAMADRKRFFVKGSKP